MTQPKKPEKRLASEMLGWTDKDVVRDLRNEIKGYNQAIDKMEAYYKPIVEELVEALKDLSDSIDDGTTLSGQRLENVDKIIAKYKEMR